MMCPRLLVVAALFLLFQHGSTTPAQEVDLRDLVFGPPITSVPATSTSSFNWWPYPPMGEITTTTPSTPSGNAMYSVTSATAPSSAVITTTSSQDATSITSYIDINALPPDATSSPHPHALAKAAFKSVYLVPVFALVGFVAGSLCAWACFRRNSRSGRSASSDLLEPGPPYRATERDLDDKDEGSPSKFSMHGPTYLDDRGLLARKSSCCTSCSAQIVSSPLNPFTWPAVTPRSHERDPFLVAQSMAASSPARSMTDFMSPDPLTLIRYDEQDDGDEVVIAPYDSLNHKSIRAGILDKVKLGAPRRKGGGIRSRNGHSRMDSDYQVVDADGWGLGWMKEKKDGVDTYTALPSRMASARSSVYSSPTGMRRVDSTVLPTSPTVLSSAKLDSEFFFSPASSILKTPEKRKRTGKSLRDGKTLPLPPPSFDLSIAPSLGAISSLRPSLSYYSGSPPPKRSAAERYTARHSALTKVDEIVSKSRSENVISVPQSPTLFGAVSQGNEGKQLVGFCDLEETGIEQRLLG